MRGGVKLPQTDLFAVISEPLGVKGNALVTFPICLDYRMAHFLQLYCHPEIQNGGRKNRWQIYLNS
jgi:hypothetical protein